MKSFSGFVGILTPGFASILLAVFSCDRANLPPVAQIQVFPPFGDTSILFEFHADESKDDRSFKIALQYRWDFEGDGVWDTEFSGNSAIANKYTQPGHYVAAVEVKDLDDFSSIAKDSVTVFGENLDIDTLSDSRDGNRYRIVKIDNRWWMAENLRYGIVIPTDREQTDNDTVEMYRLAQSVLLDTTSGIYLWLEAKNYSVNDPKGICPEGWHLPTREEWEDLFILYPDLYSLQYYGQEGLSKLNLDLNNGGIRIDGLFTERSIHEPWNSGFWSSSHKMEDQVYLPYFCSFSSPDEILATGYWSSKDWPLNRYYSVRCVKDN